MGASGDGGASSELSYARDEELMWLLVGADRLHLRARERSLDIIPWCPTKRISANGVGGEMRSESITR
jgi:hypothetical protein